jgi:hypothetical protein
MRSRKLFSFNINALIESATNFIQHPASSSILHGPLSWDRVINRHSGSGRPMAAGCRIPAGGVPLAMSLLAFARFHTSVTCASRAKSRAVLHAERGRVASRTHQVSSNRQDHAPCASLGVSMIGCESRRDNEEGCPASDILPCPSHQVGGHAGKRLIQRLDKGIRA